MAFYVVVNLIFCTHVFTEGTVEQFTVGDIINVWCITIQKNTNVNIYQRGKEYTLKGTASLKPLLKHNFYHLKLTLTF